MGVSLACLGFLPFNVPKARVFMGDVGSILLGGAFGSLVYLASDNFLDFACLAAFLFPFYVDELTTMIVRLRDGERLTQAHRRHLYQLLANEKGWPHWQVSLGFGALQLLVGLTSLPAALYYPGAALVMLGCYAMGSAAATYYVRHHLDHLPTQPKCGAKAPELSGRV
jgi:UDP-N-acetylmuramyl pentapeptide phosphotransferase/UDP-N-acetylglucosamine-1-phosphate transferase